jgi:hypothetical protein
MLDKKVAGLYMNCRHWEKLKRLYIPIILETARLLAALIRPNHLVN